MKLKVIGLAIGTGLLLGFSLPAGAQVFTAQHNFTNTPDGANPKQVAWMNGSFYGPTANGGTNGSGAIYKFTTNGSVFTTIYSFTGAADSGSSPNSLLVTSSQIYGTTGSGGTNGAGTIFAFNTNGTGFTSLHSFGLLQDGSYPAAGLILNGATLYGTAQAGGTNGFGTIFALNTNGSGYATLHSFTNTPDGNQPVSELVLSGSTLFGTTTYGGTNGYGTIFALNTNGGSYTILRSFTNLPDARYPRSALVMDSGVLYGTTSGGGSNQTGAIFAIKTNGTGYNILHHFTSLAANTDGSIPKALMFSGGYLYGTTGSGGSGGGGTIFKINTNGTGFAVLKSFTNFPAATDPEAGVLLLGNTVWGTTYFGGTGSYGVLFNLLLSPVITAQPQSLTVTNGNPASFTVTATDDVVTNYQWYFNTNTLLGGQTGKTLTLASATNNNAGTYTVVVSDNFGAVTSSPAVLTVNSTSTPPVIAQQPLNYTVTNGYTATFTNVASGTAPLYYQWYFNTNTAVAGGTNSILLVAFAATNQAGYYTVIVSNTTGKATSGPALLTVISTKPIIFTQPQNLTVISGDTASFAVTAAGQNPLRYQWYGSSVSNSIGSLLANQTNSLFSFTTSTNSNGRFYSVIMTNLLGKATSSPALLTVIGSPVITTNPQPLTVNLGASAAFSVAALGPSLSYQWYSNSVNTAIGTRLAGETSSTYSFTAATNQNGRYYSVVVTNTFGRATSSPPALLTVQLVVATGQPKFLSYSLIPASSSFAFTVTNTPSSANRLWASTNLTKTNFWGVIASNTMAANGLWLFTDTNVVKTNRIRFYRASSP